MPKFTRRSIPALLASASGLAAGFVAAAKADAGLDPVYEMINRVAEAEKAYRRAAAVHEKAERRFFAQRAKLPVPAHDGVALLTHVAVDTHVNGLSLDVGVRASLHRVLTRRGDPTADRFAPTTEDLQADREWDALRERLHGEVAAYETACDRVRIDSGLAAAEAPHIQACDERFERLDAALATVPTTQAGAVALIRVALAEVKASRNDEYGKGRSGASDDRDAGVHPCRPAGESNCARFLCLGRRRGGHPVQRSADDGCAACATAALQSVAAFLSREV